MGRKKDETMRVAGKGVYKVRRSRSKERRDHGREKTRRRKKIIWERLKRKLICVKQIQLSVKFENNRKGKRKCEGKVMRERKPADT